MGLHRQHGLTLVELVISMVLIGIAVAGILSVITQTTRHSADPMIQHQAVAIAEAYLEEILTKSYTAQPGGGSRANFDDIDDYDGLADSGAEDQFGNPIAGLDSYNVAVTVTDTTLSGVNAKRIDVRVTHTNMVDLTLSGYRTDY